MKRSRRLGTLILLLSLTVVLSAVASLISAQANPGVRTANHLRTGKLTYVGASVAAPVQIAQATAAGLSSADRASAILAVYAPQFGVANPAQDLTFKREFVTRQNLVSRRYQQTYQGIPVFAGELIVNATRDGGLVSMFGDISPDLNVNTKAKLSAADAQQLAIQASAKAFGTSQANLVASAPALWIYDERLLTTSDAAPALVWRVQVTSVAGKLVNGVVLVDARKGYISLIYNTIDDHWGTGDTSALINLPGVNVDNAQLAASESVQNRAPGTADMATYTANNTPNLPGTFLCDETNLACTNGANADADAAHLHAKGTYDMYWDWHGRDSLDDEGLQLVSTVNYIIGYCNAGWTGYQMIYGDGCPTSIALDDVIGHELTHGVVQFTSGLVYAYEPGAMNESFADVWGEFYDLTNGSADDTSANRWKLAEPLDGNGIRNMKDPTLFGDPDRRLSPNYYEGPLDYGGVHTNSGVNNKAAYLMVDGDTFNGYTINGIGIPKTAAIYYDVQTTKLNSGSGYYELYLALNQACQELIGGVEGITAADCDEVEKATLATEMNEAPFIEAETAEICATNDPVYLFNDGLEDGDANWVSGATTGPNAWTIASDQSPLIGSYSNLGKALPTTSVSFAAMNSSVTLPANAYLHFSHRYAFESYSAVESYDGGIIEYSTNDGASWTQLPSAGFFEDGQDYNGTLHASNPLGAKAAFVSTSNIGIASTRYSLNSLAGQSVRFRWVIGTDEGTSTQGWRIDDIKIYTCEEEAETTPTATATDEGPTPTPTETEVVGVELLVNGGFEVDQDEDKVPDGWTGKGLAGDKQKCNKPGKDIAYEGDCVLQFKGSAAEKSKLSQNPDVSGLVAGDTLTLSGYAFAKGSPNAKIKIRVIYADENLAKGKITVKLNTVIPTWTALTGDLQVVLEDTPDTIKVILQNKSKAGKVRLDGLSLLQTTGEVSSLLPLP